MKSKVGSFRKMMKSINQTDQRKKRHKLLLLEMRGRRAGLQKHEEIFQGDFWVYVHCLDCGDGFTCVYINILSWTF